MLQSVPTFLVLCDDVDLFLSGEVLNQLDDVRVSALRQYVGLLQLLYLTALVKRLLVYYLDCCNHASNFVLSKLN